MDSIIFEKSKKFAIRIVGLYSFLCNKKREYVMSKQMLRCGTSIGANLAEAKYAISENDFLAKLYISLKETSETIYWLDILHEASFVDDETYLSINEDATEIRKMLSSSTKTISNRKKGINAVPKPQQKDQNE